MRLIQKQMGLLADLLYFVHNFTKDLQQHYFSDENIKTLDQAYRCALLGSVASILESLKEASLFKEPYRNDVRNFMYHYPWHFDDLTTEEIRILAIYIYHRCRDALKQFNFANIVLNHRVDLPNGKRIFYQIAAKPKDRGNTVKLISQVRADRTFIDKLDVFSSDPSFYAPVQSIFGIDKGRDYMLAIEGNAKAYCWGTLSACSRDLVFDMHAQEQLRLQTEQFRSAHGVHVERANSFRHNQRTCLIFSNIWAGKLWSLLSDSQDEPKDQELLSLVENDCDVSVRNAHGTTPLLMAASQGKWCAVYLLLNLGADINETNNIRLTVLLCAVLQDKEVFVKDLYRRYPNINPNCEFISGHNVLIFALQAGNIRLFQWFLDPQRKLDNKIITATLIFLLRFPIEKLEIRQQIFAIHLLLEHGANVLEADKDGWTPLLYLGYGPLIYDEDIWIELLDIMVRYGADINALGYSEYNRTALFAAVTHNKPRLAKWILEHPNTDRSFFGVHRHTIAGIYRDIAQPIIFDFEIPFLELIEGSLTVEDEQTDGLTHPGRLTLTL